MALEAASLQGPESMDRYFLAILSARHGKQGRIPLNRIKPLLAVAKDCGLDPKRIRRDMDNLEVITKIEQDHHEAGRHHGTWDEGGVEEQ